jgi:hypothetical protein
VTSYSTHSRFRGGNPRPRAYSSQRKGLGRVGVVMAP